MQKPIPGAVETRTVRRTELIMMVTIFCRGEEVTALVFQISTEAYFAQFPVGAMWLDAATAEGRGVRSDRAGECNNALESDSFSVFGWTTRAYNRLWCLFDRPSWCRVCCRGVDMRFPHGKRACSPFQAQEYMSISIPLFFICAMPGVSFDT